MLFTSIILINHHIRVRGYILRLGELNFVNSFIFKQSSFLNLLAFLCCITAPGSSSTPGQAAALPVMSRKILQVNLGNLLGIYWSTPGF